MGPESTTAFLLAARIESLLSGAGWYLLSGPASDLSQIADALEAEARWQGFALGQVAVQPPANLPDRLRAAPEPALLVIVEGVAATALANLLEAERSQLPVDKQVVLLATPGDALILQEQAPHFASFLVESQAFVSERIASIDAEEREARLVALRTTLGRTDADVIALAQEGRLPPDPEYAEWLLLLGRDDLA